MAKRKSAPRKTKHESPFVTKRTVLPVQLAALIIFSLFLLLLPGSNVYASIEAEPQPINLQKLPILIPSPHPYPLVNPEATPSVSAKAFVIADYDTGVLLLQRQMQLPLRPASLTKLLTAVVASEYCKPNDVLSAVTALKTEESRMYLQAGEKITFDNILYGLLLPSGNDAAQTMAAQCKPAQANFVALLNRKAKEFGMFSTINANADGEDAHENQTTAYDMLLLTQQFLKNAHFATIVQTPYKEVYDITGTIKHPLYNTNVLLSDKSNLGVKTGTTAEAGQNFIALYRLKGGQRIVVVLLASQDRFVEAQRLRRFVEANVQWQLPAQTPDQTLQNLGVQIGLE